MIYIISKTRLFYWFIYDILVIFSEDVFFIDNFVLLLKFHWRSEDRIRKESDLTQLMACPEYRYLIRPLTFTLHTWAYSDPYNDIPSWGKVGPVTQETASFQTLLTLTYTWRCHMASWIFVMT